MDISSFLDYLALERKYSVHTVKAYAGDIESFFEFIFAEYGALEVSDISYNLIRTWIVRLTDEGVGNRSINRKIASLKAYFKFLQKIGEVSQSPLAKHKSLKVKRELQIPFSGEEIDAVLSELSNANDFKSLRDLAIVSLFYATGMRRSELINLQLRDLDFERKSIKVLGKRNKERIIPLINWVIDILKRYVDSRNVNFRSDIDGNLLLTNKGENLYDTFVYRTINRYFSKVSQKTKTSPHMLRHTFATHLLNNGADLNAVKELLGHASLASTQVYTHTSMAKLSKVYQNTHPRNRD